MRGHRGHNGKVKGISAKDISKAMEESKQVATTCASCAGTGLKRLPEKLLKIYALCIALSKHSNDGFFSIKDLRSLYLDNNDDIKGPSYFISGINELWMKGVIIRKRNSDNGHYRYSISKNLSSMPGVKVE